MMFQVLDEMLSLEPVIVIFVMIFMVVLNIYFFSKKQVWVISLSILIFSIFIWGSSLGYNIPLAPYFQNFFMLFQALIFIVISYKIYKK